MKFFLSKPFIIVIIVAILGGVFVYVITHEKQQVKPEVIIEEPKQVGSVNKVIGLSIEKRKIESFTYGTGKNHLVFVGGIHGGYEWNSVFLAYKFIDYLNANPTIIPKNLTVTVIPSANPDGLFKVVGKEGRFNVADVPTDKALLASGRFNANKVDLNRNFDCKWQPQSKWQSKTVSAGTAPFSEPEALSIKNFVTKNNPTAFVFWHSQSNAIYSSKCTGEILPETMNIMNAYSKASGYPTAKSFDSYEITGDSTDWLATIKIPAITVELKTHETIEWEKNLAGIKALFEYYSKKN